MHVSQAIAHVQEWINIHSHEFAGFRAAHLMGDILSLPAHAIFQTYHAIDFTIVCTDVSVPTTHTVRYQGLILEYRIVGANHYRTSLHVLENAELAPNLAKGGILADPYRLLTPIQPIVAALYPQRQWMQSRCDHKRHMLHQCLEGLRHASTPQAAFWPLVNVGLCASGLLAEATMNPPTHRRSLARQREILAQHGRTDLHRTVLDIIGWSHLCRHDVEWYASKCSAAFDYAITVTKTPVPFQYKLQPHVRPYLVYGTQELIERGDHQEAMAWISEFLWLTNTAIQRDAPAAQRPFFQATLDRLIADMGLRTPADIAERAIAVETLIATLLETADDLMNLYSQSIPQEALWC